MAYHGVRFTAVFTNVLVSRLPVNSGMRIAAHDYDNHGHGEFQRIRPNEHQRTE